MKQKIGPYGNINIDGTRESSSMILNNQEEGFLDEIEDGIKPLVITCINAGIETFSSCEGHKYPDGKIVPRGIDIIIDKDREHEWVEYINDLRVKHNLSIDIYIFKLGEDHYYMLNKKYNSPIRFSMFFMEKSKYDFTTQVLIESIANKEFPNII